MGSASTIALGIALARPERQVLIVDGDGSLLMQLGSLVTIAGAAPPNLFHFVFENGVYETSGSQPLPAEGRFDLAQMAGAAGYAHVASFDDGPTFARALPELLRQRGPVFASVRTEPEDGFLVRSSSGTRLDVQMHALRSRLVGEPA
jgi:phosphonopyruvate decarboxylase